MFCFIASFAFVLQRLWAKPIPLWLHSSKGSPSGRAPAIAGERVIVAIILPLRRLRRHLSQWERLFVSSIITQIGRGNNSSAEIYMCIRRRPAVSRGRTQFAPTVFRKYPYEKERKRRFFRSYLDFQALSAFFFFPVASKLTLTKSFATSSGASGRSREIQWSLFM